MLCAVGGEIDWIMVQYYNNPDYQAPVNQRIAGRSPQPFATSYVGIVGLSWPSEKTLFGLPVYRDDVSSGRLQPDRVISAVVCPLRERYGQSFGGLTGWQFSTLTADHRFWNNQMAGAVIGSDCLR
ncbi:MAG: hypothetical protein ACPGQM_06435 [Alphaproteobacteria bacterium]